ncbi:hypothetical protein [Streptomyces hesseae]|uniref:Uncharacterized protein n=1 Tax=Streptomyces hesseae TaxID=3075519 RepID=A0ABU2SKF5_9ACTN|nr:hypothetical protein [Streptomyces sp. DSM 40473]MDT0448394.1 hypothetical protein [Streptomyces sp. DSM 40473]
MEITYARGRLGLPELTTISKFGLGLSMVTLPGRSSAEEVPSCSSQ